MSGYGYLFLGMTLMTRTSRNYWFNSATLIVILAGVWFVQETVLDQKERMRSDFLEQARELALAIDPTSVGNISSSTDNSLNPHYWRLKSHFRALAEKDPLVDRIYLLNTSDDKPVRNLVSSTGDDSGPFREPDWAQDLATPELVSALTNREEVSLGTLCNDRSGRTHALVSVAGDSRDPWPATLVLNFSDKNFQAKLVRPALPPMVLMILVLAVLRTTRKFLDIREAELQPQNWLIQNTELVATLSVCLLLTAGVTFKFQNMVVSQRQEEFHQLAELEIARLSRELNHDQGLNSVEAFFQGSSHVSAGEFSEFTEHLLQSGQFLQLGWIDVISDRNNPAPYQLQYLSPPIPSLSLPDKDLVEDHDLRSILAEAQVTGMTISSTTSQPFSNLVLGQSIVLAHPVYQNDQPDQLQGILLGILNPNNLWGKNRPFQKQAKPEAPIHLELSAHPSSKQERILTGKG